MTRALPALASRGLAVLVLLAAIGLVYLAAIAPLLSDYAETSRSIVELRAANERYREIGAALPARRATLASLRQRQTAAEGFLQGTNDALVAAQIQNRVKALVEAAHGELKTTQVLPVQEEGKYRRVTLRAQMTLDLGAAQRVIYGVETASPLLFLDNLYLRARSNERHRDRGEDGSLDLRFDVYGYMREQTAEQQSVATAAGAPAPATEPTRAMRR